MASMYKFVLRLPDALAKDLQEEANAQGVSLNQYILYVLSRFGIRRKGDENGKDQKANEPV